MVTLIEDAVLADDRIRAEPRPRLELAEIAKDKLVLHMRPWTDAAAQGDVATALLLLGRPRSRRLASSTRSRS